MAKAKPSTAPKGSKPPKAAKTVKPEPAKPGRPSLYSPELVEAICERIANKEPLHRICDADDMPHEKTVVRWLGEKVEFRDQYARARERAADKFVSEIIDIADEVELSKLGEVERARLRIDARKWTAGKLSGKYSDKSRVELTGKDGLPIQHQAALPDLTALSMDELNLLEALHAKIAAAQGDSEGEV